MTQGEIDWVTLRGAGSGLEFSLRDSTEVVGESKVEIKGLLPGDYVVRYGGLVLRTQVSDSLQIALSTADATLIGIEKV